MKFVSTLPIFPRTSNEPFKYASTVAASLVSEALGLGAVYPVNMIGAKRALGDVEGYASVLKRFGIHAEPWRDDIEAPPAISAIVEEGIACGLITKERRDVLVCPCGLLETLASASNLTNIGRVPNVAIVSDSGVVCRKCGATAAKKEQEVLLLTPETAPRGFRVFPAFMQQELDEQLGFFRGLPLLLSRTSEHRLAVESSLGRFRLDSDFLWMCYPGLLRQSGKALSVLISNCRQVKQVAQVLLVSSALGWDVPENVMFHAQARWTREPQRTEGQTLFDESPGVLRCLAAHVFDAHRKDVTVDSLIVHGARISLPRAPRFPQEVQNMVSIDDLFRACRTSSIQAMLKACRKGTVAQLEAGTLSLLRSIILPAQ